VATAFVTMAVVVNARTVFSLFFPSILDEFGWSRAVTAAIFTTGLLAANVFTPFLGVLMDRLGPRIVFSFGLCLMTIGLALATGATTPWQLHLTLGAAAQEPGLQGGVADLLAVLVDDPRPGEVVEERPPVVGEDQLLAELVRLDRRIVEVAVALPRPEQPRDRRAVGVEVVGELEHHVGQSSVGTCPEPWS